MIHLFWGLGFEFVIGQQLSFVLPVFLQIPFFCGGGFDIYMDRFFVGPRFGFCPGMDYKGAGPL